MHMRKRFPGWQNFLAIALLSLAVVSCGGSSGDEGGTSPAGVAQDPVAAPPTTTAQTATVTVLLTDAPSDDFAQINVTVTGIELLGGPERVLLFEGSETVDILALENFADLFSVTNDVPAGNYSKIRLYISDLELVREDAVGNVIETIYPALPANGKLDLNPRGDFDIAPGENVLLQLDMDARRSIHIVGTGNGRYKFRPVIFVDVLTGDSDGKIARVNGEIIAIDEANSRFEVCQQRPSASASNSNDSDKDKDKDKDDDGDNQQHCVVVHVSDLTGLFDENADNIAFADLMLGDQVTVIGRFADADIYAAVLLEAVVVARGSNGTFERFDGTVTSAADANNRFGFAFAAGQGFADGTMVEVELLPGAGIADDEGQLVGADQIQQDVVAEIEGLLMLSSTEPDTLRAIFVVLDLSDDMPGDEEIRIRGEVLGVDAASSSLTLATTDGDRCVNLLDDGRVFLISVTADDSTTDPIALADIPLNSQADIYGQERLDGCFGASIVLVFAPE